MRKTITIIIFLASGICSAQTAAEVRAELHRQGVPHPEIVLAQSRLETGNYTSRLCKTRHNIFGIKHNGRYARYGSWRESIADYKKRISSRYRSGENYYAFLRRIGYASDPRYIAKVRKMAGR